MDTEGTNTDRFPLMPRGHRRRKEFRWGRTGEDARRSTDVDDRYQFLYGRCAFIQGRFLLGRQFDLDVPLDALGAKFYWRLAAAWRRSSPTTKLDQSAGIVSEIGSQQLTSEWPHTLSR
jgi:hypothetical protein